MDRRGGDARSGLVWRAVEAVWPPCVELPWPGPAGEGSCYGARMQRITTSLPDDLAAALVREARRRRISVSQLVREILGASLGKGPQERRLSFIGLGRSGYRSTAREIEAILATEWSGDRRR